MDWLVVGARPYVPVFLHSVFLGLWEYFSGRYTDFNSDTLGLSTLVWHTLSILKAVTLPAW